MGTPAHRSLLGFFEQATYCSVWHVGSSTASHRHFQQGQLDTSWASLSWLAGLRQNSGETAKPPLPMQLGMIARIVAPYVDAGLLKLMQLTQDWSS